MSPTDRPVSPEAAPGGVGSAINRVVAKREAIDAEAAPPRATTADESRCMIWSGDDRCVRDKHALGGCTFADDQTSPPRAPLAAHPATTPAVAGLDELRAAHEKARVTFIEIQDEYERGAISHEAFQQAAFEEESALDAYHRALSTLERDAARMRRDVQRAFETADALANALTQDSDSGDFGRALQERAHAACKLFAQLARLRAALTPSGEPTTTPETSE